MPPWIKKPIATAQPWSLSITSVQHRPPSNKKRVHRARSRRRREEIDPTHKRQHPKLAAYPRPQSSDLDGDFLAPVSSLIPHSFVSLVLLHPSLLPHSAKQPGHASLHSSTASPEEDGDRRGGAREQRPPAAHQVRERRLRRSAGVRALPVSSPPSHILLFLIPTRGGFGLAVVVLCWFSGDPLGRFRFAVWGGGGGGGVPGG
jgi:hypothetical protein